MSGIPIKTGGWRDKARWGQPCIFSSPRLATSPKEEVFDTPSPARPEDASNPRNSLSDAEPTGDTPVWTPHTPPQIPESLTVSPATPLLDQFSPSPQRGAPHLGVYPDPRRVANTDPRPSPSKSSGLHRQASSLAPAAHPRCPTHHHDPSLHTDNPKGPGLSISPPPPPTPRSFRPCTAPLSQIRAAPHDLHTASRDQPKTRVAHWPRPRLPLAAADPVTKRSLDDDQRSSCLERWGHILSRLKGHSPVAQAWHDSQRPGTGTVAPPLQYHHSHNIYEVSGQLSRLPLGRGPRHRRPHLGGAHRLPFRRTKWPGGGQILQPDLPSHHAQSPLMASKSGST